MIKGGGSTCNIITYIIIKSGSVSLMRSFIYYLRNEILSYYQLQIMLTSLGAGVMMEDTQTERQEDTERDVFCADLCPH